MKRIYYTPGLEFWSWKTWSKCSSPNLCVSTAITCHQILATIILSNSKTYITTKLDKKLEMSTFKLFSAPKQGKKSCIISVWKIGKVFRKNIVNVLSKNLKNFVKKSYYTITIDMIYYEKYLAVTSFAIGLLLILYCYFCASIVSAILFMLYIYTKQIELFYFYFILFYFFDFDFFHFFIF